MKYEFFIDPAEINKFAESEISNREKLLYFQWWKKKFNLISDDLGYVLLFTRDYAKDLINPDEVKSKKKNVFFETFNDILNSVVEEEYDKSPKNFSNQQEAKEYYDWQIVDRIQRSNERVNLEIEFLEKQIEIEDRIVKMDKQDQKVNNIKVEEEETGAVVTKDFSFLLTWLIEKENLEVLLKLLHKYRFLEIGKNLNTLVSAMLGENQENKLVGPLNWLGNLSDLAGLVNTLIDLRWIDVPKNINKTIAHDFLFKGEKIKTDSFKNLRNTLVNRQSLNRISDKMNVLLYKINKIADKQTLKTP